MLKFGIWTQEQYLREGERRKLFGHRVSYSLLNVGDNPTPEQIRVFEDISFTLRTSNGTFRTTFRNRFSQIDNLVLERLGELYAPGTALVVEDRAVSHALTSLEWACKLFPCFPNARFFASDILLYLIELTLPNGDVFVVEPNGKPLQYIRPPFVVSLQHREAKRYPVNSWVAALVRRRFAGLALPEGWMEGAGEYSVRRIPFIHPEARALSRSNPRFQVCLQSVFDVSTAPCHVIRTMNIFNRGYFSEQQLMEGARAVHQSLLPGGIWIVGRTLEEDLSNHGAVLRRSPGGWDVIDRIGDGSEMEAIALPRPIHA